MNDPEPPNSLSEMGLYKLDHIHHYLATISTKSRWTFSDTSSFDCMHYNGNAALENAARQLKLHAKNRILDIGSGYGVAGRYFYFHHGTTTIGIERQTDIYLVAELINRKNSMPLEVFSVNGNILDIMPEDLGGSESFDHAVSFLAILHIPERHRLFGKVAQTLKPGGKFYIEDFFAPSKTLDDVTSDVLKKHVLCSYLPNKEAYLKHLKDAGFGNILWEDISLTWSEFVHERYEKYREKVDCFDPSLKEFYAIIDKLFGTKKIGGVRITAEKLN